ncbi:synaptobrevin-1-like [Euwallacea fornicatus]|uniref:synaptobrevin-1-like n=1 Tax=Euwallacea fornicatus TaxID=995702 RepID=UPI00338D41F9
MENPSGSTRPPSKLEQTQQQVNEVVGIMRVNVEKVLERDQKLTELDARADALQEGGKRFEQQAQKLKRKYWWKNLKMMIIIGVIAVILLTIIIISIAKGSGSDSDSDSTMKAPHENMKIQSVDPTTSPH